MEMRERVNIQRAATLRSERQIAGDIDEAYRRMYNAIGPQVDALTRAMADARDAGADVNYAWLLRGARLRDLMTLIRDQSTTFALSAEQLVTRGQRIVAAAAGDDARALLDDALGAVSRDAGLPLAFARMPAEALDALAGRSTYNDGPLSRLFQSFGTDAANKARAILYTAIATGDAPDAIASQLAQALNIARWRALTIARTEMMGAYRDSALGTYRANSDVCSGWQWLAAAGACPICVDLDGTQYSLDEDFDGAHPNCRCTCVPLVRSYDDILAGLDSAA